MVSIRRYAEEQSEYNEIQKTLEDADKQFRQCERKDICLQETINATTNKAKKLQAQIGQVRSCAHGIAELTPLACVRQKHV